MNTVPMRISSAADMRGGTSDMDAWSMSRNSPRALSQFRFHGSGWQSHHKTLVGYNSDYPGYVYAAHFDFHMEVTSPMMPHSIPGLIDHIM